MNRHIRYTCNKKNVTVLRDDCRKCSEYNPCAKDGKWCFIGALVAEHDPVCAELVASTLENADAPVLRDLSTIIINLGDGMTVDVLKEDIKTALERDFYKEAGMMFGA